MSLDINAVLFFIDIDFKIKTGEGATPIFFGARSFYKISTPLLPEKSLPSKPESFGISE